MTLTDTRIRKAKAETKPHKLTDGKGLYLEVRPTGAKLWRYRYRIEAKENVFAMGEYVRAPEDETPSEAEIRRRAGRLTLAEARSERERCRGLVKAGIHPRREREREKAAKAADNANTFEAVAKEWIAQRRDHWSAYYLTQVENFFGNDVYPEIGSTPIRAVSAADVLRVVKKIEDRGAATVAILVRQWCSAVFRYAVATLRADADPAAPLKGAVHKPKVKHHKALSRDELQLFFNALDTYGGFRPTVIALRLALLTFVRPGELRAAEWTEFDLDRAEWRIPAGKMKMGEEHVVPLSTQAVALLRELHTLTGGRNFLFPNNRRPRTCMTMTTLNRALERMGLNGRNGIGFSAHGFRATASTMLNEMGYRPEVIERQLAHKERNKVRASYNHAAYLDERRAMMQQWANILADIESSQSADVLTIKRAG